MTDPYVLFDQARKQGPNPFRLEPVITDTEVWGEVMTDLPELNQHLDEKIYQAISEVRNKYSRKIGVVIKGDRGTGKSHVIHRIWKTIERESMCVFAYIPPFDNPSHINSHVRLYLAKSFSHSNIHGVTQWQKLVVSVLKTLVGTEFEGRYSPYLERCGQPEELRKYILETIGRDSKKLINFFDELVETLLEFHPELEFDFLKAALFSIFKNASISRVALAWIRGEEHPYFIKAGLPEYSAETQEERSILTIQQICKFAEVGGLPVTLCFDQLDSAATDKECGDSPAQTIAKCIDQIYFQSSNVVILCCVISDTWREIEQMGGGIPDRVGQWTVTAKPPTAEQMLALVRLRLEWFYRKNSLNYDDYPDLYPFDRSQITSVASESAGTRAFFKNWCADKFEDTGTPPIKKFLEIFNERLKKISIPENNEDKLAAIIALGMQMIPNGGTENIVITEVQYLNEKLHDLSLTVTGYDTLQQKEVRVGIKVCETGKGATFNAAMKRLIDYDKYKISRGCLIRTTPIPNGWKVGKQLEQKLVKEKGGEVVELKKNELKPLAVIQGIYEDAENYGFTKDEVSNFVKELRLAADNPLICEILSAPV